MTPVPPSIPPQAYELALVTLRKVSEAPDASCPAIPWEDFTPGQAQTDAWSLPLGYVVTGLLLAPPRVGEPVRILRLIRNDVPAAGLFETSPAVELRPGWVLTRNSLYAIRTLHPFGSAPHASTPHE